MSNVDSQKTEGIISIPSSWIKIKRERDRYKKALEYCLETMEQAARLYRDENRINIFDTAEMVALEALSNENSNSKEAKG